MLSWMIRCCVLCHPGKIPDDGWATTPKARDMPKILSVDFMRAVDRFVGIPLCHLTGLALPPSSPTPIRRILVIKFFGIGSIILITPALAILRAAFPEVIIDMLTFHSQSGLAE